MFKLCYFDLPVSVVSDSVPSCLQYTLVPIAATLRPSYISHNQYETNKLTCLLPQVML